jgi:thiol-disulfide isomerase/thioredoxin
VEEGDELRPSKVHIGLFILGAVFIVGGCGRESPDRTSVEPVLIDADLAAIKSQLAPGGGTRVVNLWATWCQPCVEELPDLAALDAAHRDGGIKMIGISLDLAVPGDKPVIESRVRDFLRGHGIRYPNLLYTGSVPDLLEALDLPGPIPYTLVVANDGQVRWRQEGRTTRARIEAALAEADLAGGTGGPDG